MSLQQGITMEILQSDDKLREEILSDAKTKAERIIKKAEKEAEDIKKGIEKEIENLKKEYEDTILGDAENVIKLTLASVDIEVKKEVTSFCGKIVDEAFEDMKNSVLNDKSFKYKELIFKLIEKSSDIMGANAFIVELNDNELKKLNKSDLLGLKLKTGKIKEVITSNLKEGLMLFSEDRKLVSCISINTYIESLKSRIRNDVYRVIV